MACILFVQSEPNHWWLRTSNPFTGFMSNADSVEQYHKCKVSACKLSIKCFTQVQVKSSFGVCSFKFISSQTKQNHGEIQI